MSKQGLTVGELIAELRLRDPNTFVLVDDIRGYSPIVSLEDFVAWEADDDIFQGYTNDVMRGKRSTGRPAVYLNTVPKKSRL